MKSRTKIGKVYLIKGYNGLLRIGKSLSVPINYKGIKNSEEGFEVELRASYTPKSIYYEDLENRLKSHYHQYRQENGLLKTEISGREFLEVCRELDS